MNRDEIGSKLLVKTVLSINNQRVSEPPKNSQNKYVNSVLYGNKHEKRNGEWGYRKINVKVREQPLIVPSDNGECIIRKASWASYCSCNVTACYGLKFGLFDARRRPLPVFNFSSNVSDVINGFNSRVQENILLKRIWALCKYLQFE